MRRREQIQTARIHDAFTTISDVASVAFEKQNNENPLECIRVYPRACKVYLVCLTHVARARAWRWSY